jgi:hypothetical protein
MEDNLDTLFLAAQAFVIVAVLANIIILHKFRKLVGDYRRALASPIYHWLFHVLVFYIVTMVYRLGYVELSWFQSYHTYWSLILRLHGQIAIFATILGTASREGIWKLLLTIPHWRS